MKNCQTAEETKQIKSCFFEKPKNVDKALAGMIKK